MTKLALAAFLVACGGSAGDASDAATDASIKSDAYGHKPIDASENLFDAAGDGAKTPEDRMEPHQGIVIATPELRAIYVGTSGTDLQTNQDAFLIWLVSSTDYWSILAQYKVGLGTFMSSTTIATSSFFQAGDVVAGYVNWETLELRVRSAIATLPTDGGAANEYIIFLPLFVNVDLGDGTKTCVQAGGYHSYDDVEPYAIIPACGDGGLVISHEMAEMSTDPIPSAGWYSDADEDNAGGEVGDLCNFGASVDGKIVTQLWSNADGQCMPPE